MDDLERQLREGLDEVEKLPVENQLPELLKRIQDYQEGALARLQQEQQRAERGLRIRLWAMRAFIFIIAAAVGFDVIRLILGK